MDFIAIVEELERSLSAMPAERRSLFAFCSVEVLWSRYGALLAEFTTKTAFEEIELAYEALGDCAVRNTSLNRRLGEEYFRMTQDLLPDMEDVRGMDARDRLHQAANLLDNSLT